MEHIDIIKAERDSWKSTADALAKALRLLTEKVRTNTDMTACEIIGEYWKAEEVLHSYDCMRHPILSAKK